MDPKGLFRAQILPVGKGVLGVPVQAVKGSSGLLTARGWGFSAGRVSGERERARQ